MKSPLALTLSLILLLAVLGPVSSLPATPYQAQAPRAELGQVVVNLTSPGTFVRIDGLDRSLDDILLATQSPSAAVLAIYAEPGAWKKFNSRASGNDRPGLSCHALISTPAPMAARTVSPEEFTRIKKDLAQNLKNTVGRERRLENELSGVSDHQVESAKGLMESFDILDESPNFLTYRLVSSLELKLKDLKQPRRSQSVTISTTLLLSGKIINLQVVTDDPQGLAPARLEEIARAWRAEFLQNNSALK